MKQIYVTFMLMCTGISNRIQNRKTSTGRTKRKVKINKATKMCFFTGIYQKALSNLVEFNQRHAYMPETRWNLPSYRWLAVTKYFYFFVHKKVNLPSSWMCLCPNALNSVYVKEIIC